MSPKSILKCQCTTTFIIFSSKKKTFERISKTSKLFLQTRFEANLMHERKSYKIKKLKFCKKEIKISE